MKPGRLRTELLAPAGDRECLRAAVDAGADAVYFGLQRFSARARAANFDVETLPEVMAELRGANVRGYLAVNTLLFNEELDLAAETVSAAAEAGLDALIVQDLGLARLAREIAPTLPLHASTQMTLSATGGIEFARRELGISRFILPRELNLEQIEKLAKATGADLEVFVHGALCISYGGQCLASFAMGGRSGNRGRCAQPCRLPYALLTEEGARNSPRPYPLSPRDLAAWELLPELVRLGVRSLKIEGRLKGPRYVETVTAFYRQALDAALAGSEFTPSTQDRDHLAAGFSRGFTRGFVGGTAHSDIVDGRHSGNLGVRVGTVANVTNRGVVVQPDKDIHPGDGLAFHPEEGQLERQGGRVYKVLPRRTGETELRFAKGALDLEGLPAGTAVWRTSEAGGSGAIIKSGRECRIVIHAELSGNAGGALKLKLRDQDGNSAAASWPGPLELARRHPPTPELLAAQLGRLGGTPFALGEVDASDLGDLMLPKSALNSLRREAVAGLLAAREERARHSIANPDALTKLRSVLPAGNSEKHTPRIALLVRSDEQLDAAIKWQTANPDSALKTICIDFRDSVRWPGAIKEIRAAGLRAALATPRITEPGEEELLEAVAAAAPDAVLARSLSAIEFFRQGSVEMIGDASLNAANALSCALLLDQGLARIALAAESAGRDDPFPGLDPARVEVVLYRHEPMFHTKYCLFGGDGNCHSCARPCSRGELLLRDRKDIAHPVRADVAGRTTVFSDRPIDRINQAPQLTAKGARHFRLELLDEGPRTTALLLGRAATASPTADR
jgi:U32 family peptidase